MSTFYRLRFLDVSIALWVVLALNGLAAGCGGDGPTEQPGASRDRSPARPHIYLAFSLEE